MFRLLYTIVMKVYIEPVLISNFVIDFCIMLIISKIVFSSISIKRIIFSSIFGSISVLMYPFCANPILLNILKILSAIIMIQILRPISRKQLFLSTLTMFCLSYIFGGAILSNFGSASLGGYTIKNDLNIWIILTIIIILSFIICQIIKWLKSKIITNSNIYIAELTLNNKSINIKSFIDSGNSLHDNNQPVNLINFDTFSKLTNVNLEQYLTNQFSLNDAHYISANTIAGSKKILVFTIDSLTLHRKTSQTFKNIKLGLSLNFDNSKEYKLILNSSFCYC